MPASLGRRTLARSRDTEGDAIATKNQLALKTHVNNANNANRVGGEWVGA
jgi:hypothetical protein